MRAASHARRRGDERHRRFDNLLRVHHRRTVVLDRVHSEGQVMTAVPPPKRGIHVDLVERIWDAAGPVYADEPETYRERVVRLEKARRAVLEIVIEACDCCDHSEGCDCACSCHVYDGELR